MTENELSFVDYVEALFKGAVFGFAVYGLLHAVGNIP